LNVNKSHNNHTHAFTAGHEGDHEGQSVLDRYEGDDEGQSALDRYYDEGDDEGQSALDRYEGDDEGKSGLDRLATALPRYTSKCEKSCADVC